MASQSFQLKQLPQSPPLHLSSARDHYSKHASDSSKRVDTSIRGRLDLSLYGLRCGLHHGRHAWAPILSSSEHNLW